MRLPTTALLLLATLPPTAAAQERPIPAAGSGRIAGVVHDSIAGGPLAGAIVQLVPGGDRAAVPRSVATDTAGAFALERLAPGQYEIGFLHPRLDSLALEPPVRLVTVGDSQFVRVMLAIPSPAGLRAMRCGPQPAAASGALLIGVVRGAETRAAAARTVVTAEWLEYAIGEGVIGSRVRTLQDTTDQRGGYAFCDVPTGGTVVLSAGDAAAATDRIEVPIARADLVRRDLYLGASRTLASAAAEFDAVAGVDTAPPRPWRAGDGRLRGTVIGLEGGGPVAGARVRIAGGTETLTDSRGAFELRGVPIGTRTLEVRAVGFYPEQRAVEVVDGAAPVVMKLSAFQAVLDTVRVTASRLRLANTGFAARRRQGMGRYLTAEQIMRRATFSTSDLFTMVGGMRVERTTLGDARVTVRGPFGYCTPLFVIDGQPMRNLSAEDVDAFTHPEDIAGIEIYGGSFVPAEFQDGMNPCGAVAIWTKASSNPARGWSARRRVLHGLGAIAIGVLTGVLLGRS